MPRRKPKFGFVGGPLRGLFGGGQFAPPMTVFFERFFQLIMELTFEQLPKAVGQILESLERIEDLLNLKENHTKDIDELGMLLNVQQAAKFLNARTSSIYKLTCRREIPHLKQGKRLYFVKSELFEWVKANRVKTSSEIKQEAMNFLIKSARRKMK